MRPPIIIAEGGDLIFYESALHVELYEEVQDAMGSRSVAYDSRGHLHRLDVRQVRRSHRFLYLKWTDRKTAVVVSEVESVVDRSPELRSRLINYIEHARFSHGELADRTTDELIQLAWKRRL